MPDNPNVSHDSADELLPSTLPREPEPPPLAPGLGEAPAAEPTPAASEPAPGTARIGVLLINLGTPDAANAAAVRRYLKEFLTDPRVIEKDSLLWKFVLNAVILPFRSRRKARDYRKIWTANEMNLRSRPSPARRRSSSQP